MKIDQLRALEAVSLDYMPSAVFVIELGLRSAKREGHYDPSEPIAAYRALRYLHFN